MDTASLKVSVEALRRSGVRISKPPKAAVLDPSDHIYVINYYASGCTVSQVSDKLHVEPAAIRECLAKHKMLRLE